MKPLTEVKYQRNNLFKNFFLVTLLSAGIALVANALTKDAETAIVIIPGIACVLFVALCYLKEYLGCSSYEVKVESVLPVDKDKQIIEIERFRFSEELYRTVISVLSENKAYKKLWEDAFEGETCKESKGKDFVKEFLECQFVYWLSLELNSYFTRIDDQAIDIIRREQIPDVLIRNRVIELISKPYEEREKFQSVIGNKNEDPEQGEICYIGGEDDVFFDRLEIELPRKSRVYREKEALVIKNRTFDIRFESEFHGYSTVLPRLFERCYMNRSMNETRNYQIVMKMSIRLNPLFLFYIRDWKYLGWIDQIEEKFVEYFSLDKFIERIGYEQALTTHILYMNGLHSEVENEGKYEDLRIIKAEDTEEEK